MFWRNGVFAVWLVFAGQFSAKIVQADEIVICRADNHAVHMAATSRVLRLYRYIGEEPKIVDFPTRRSLQELAAGRCQAELGRVAAALKQFPNLLKVDIPVYYIRGYAYARHPIPSIQHWSDIGNRPTGYILGEVHAESNLPKKTRLPAHDYPGLVKLLDRHRVDLIIGLDSGMRRIENVERFYRSPVPLTNTPLYHLVHGGAHELVARLNVAARALAGEQPD